MRNLLVIIRIVFVTLIHSVRSINQIKKKGQSVYFELSRKWSEKLIRIVKANLNVIGAEKLSSSENYLFVANHSSYFDIPVVLKSIPKDLSLVYKSELEKVPIFGKSLIASPFLSIDRESPRAAMKVLISTKELIRSGVSILIFPEGTRSKDGEVGKFKKGALKIAEINKLKVVPLTINGTFDILSADSKKIKTNQDVELIIHSPLELDENENFLDDVKNIIKKAKK